jgi:hypothetical protein
MKTKVIFRKWKDDGHGDIIALFPELPSDLHGVYCDSYEHVGQHGGADYYGVIKMTKLATPAEYASLKDELEGMGYELEVLKKASYASHELRRKSALGN